jgi:bacterioferritin-associated ferredoxin
MRYERVYICICNAVTDSDIRRAAESGVRTLQELKASTACGSNCGQCLEMAGEILRETLQSQRSFLQVVRQNPAA